MLVIFSNKSSNYAIFLSYMCGKLFLTNTSELSNLMGASEPSHVCDWSQLRNLWLGLFIRAQCLSWVVKAESARVFPVVILCTIARWKGVFWTWYTGSASSDLVLVFFSKFLRTGFDWASLTGVFVLPRLADIILPLLEAFAKQVLKVFELHDRILVSFNK